ncbi:MAG: ATP-dependent DNA helicase RecG [Gammaproteobacteria bacterium]
MGSLKGVGPKLGERLARLGIHTVADLLFHLPLRYQDRTRVTPIGALQPGREAVIEGEVVLTEVNRRGRPALYCRVQDGTGSLTLRFFHFNAGMQKSLERGVRLRCFGEARAGTTMPEMIHPEYRRMDGAGAIPAEERLTPIYPSTEGLYQATWRNLSDQALQLLESHAALPELLPPALRARFGLPELVESLRLVHRPPPGLADAFMGGRHPAQRRLAFEELLAQQLSLRELRRQTRAQPAVALAGRGALLTRFLAQLPFTLTQAQQRVIAEIATDLAEPHPMLRLVQGDVGSGKTVVAAAAVLRALDNGFQAALMAPTELLAEQHYRNFHGWLAPLGVETAWYTGKLQGKARATTLARIASGAARVVIGTHALFQEAVMFHSLGLVVIDEQHRFGVHQRLALREKGQSGAHVPHQLVMTATPIPRTLAMSVYADLDTSIIDELPPGRTPVKTVVVPETRRDEVIARIRLACQSGRQAYWVCTLIEESEILACQAAEDTAALLAEALPNLCIGLAHGRLKASAKEEVMAAFTAGAIDVLVATTVIEVGVDVPNASLMIIDNAERLGLAQLHQLRGRVGRGAVASSCVLLYRPPLSEPARARLAIVRDSHDGFEIARRDLELRGPGEVLGTRQTGALQWRIADLMRDQDLLPAVRAAADALLGDHPANAEALIQRWIGRDRQYVTV